MPNNTGIENTSGDQLGLKTQWNRVAWKRFSKYVRQIQQTHGEQSVPKCDGHNVKVTTFHSAYTDAICHQQVPNCELILSLKSETTFTPSSDVNELYGQICCFLGLI